MLKPRMPRSAVVCSLVLAGVTGALASATPAQAATRCKHFYPGADLRDCNFAHANLAHVNLTKADLTGDNLTDANLTGANFQEASLNNANLTGANLHGTFLYFADLQGAHVASTNFRGAQLGRVTSGSLIGTPSVLPNRWEIKVGYLIGPAADLNAADFSGHSLVGADLAGDYLFGTNLSHTNLTGANLNGSAPEGANLTAANLTSASLQHANLSNAIITRATIAHAQLAHTHLGGITSGGLVGIPVSMNSGWELVHGYLVGPTAVLIHATFGGANLSGDNLAGAILTGADIQGARLAGANLNDVTSGKVLGVPRSLPTGWRATGGYLVGPGANLYQAELSYESLTNADLTRANLLDAHLDGVTLAGATLTGVTSGGISGIPASLPTSWYLVFGYLVGPGANLTNANFTRANLDGIDLTGAILTGVTWNDTICPDGTNSDNDGGTCLSNLGWADPIEGCPQPGLGRTIQASEISSSVRGNEYTCPTESSGMDATFKITLDGSSGFLSRVGVPALRQGHRREGRTPHVRPLG